MRRMEKSGLRQKEVLQVKNEAGDHWHSYCSYSVPCTDVRICKRRLQPTHVVQAGISSSEMLPASNLKP
jgi:hypothetical protein